MSIRFTFETDSYRKTITLRDTDIRDMEIMSMWRGMKCARSELPYEEKIATIAATFKLSVERVRNIISEQERENKISYFSSESRKSNENLHS